LLSSLLQEILEMGPVNDPKMEAVVEKFKLWDCPSLEHIQYPENSNIISDLFFLASDERKKLLLWCVRTIDKKLEANKPENFLAASGTCSTSVEAERFVSGNLSHARQLMVWYGLSELLVGAADDDHVADVLKRQSDNGKLIEDLAKNLKMGSSVKIIPFSLERELKGLKKEAPPLHRLLGLEKEGQKTINQMGEEIDTREGTQDMSNVVEKAGEMADEVLRLGETFQQTFRVKMEAWVPQEGQLVKGSKARPEMEQMALSLGTVCDYMASNLELANSSHQLSSLRGEMAALSEDCLNIGNFNTSSPAL